MKDIYFWRLAKLRPMCWQLRSGEHCFIDERSHMSSCMAESMRELCGVSFKYLFHSWRLCPSWTQDPKGFTSYCHHFWGWDFLLCIVEWKPKFLIEIWTHTQARLEPKTKLIFAKAEEDSGTKWDLNSLPGLNLQWMKTKNPSHQKPAKAELKFYLSLGFLF